MKLLFPSSYEVSHVPPSVLNSNPHLLRSACSVVVQVTGTMWPNSNPVPAVLFNPAQEVTQTTSTTMAQALAPSKNFVATLDMSAEEKATAPQLEPAFEALLRSGNVHEDVIMACPVEDILDREVFVALHNTIEGSTQAVSAGLGVDPALGFSHNREMAKMVKAWNSAKIQADIKTKVDAVAKAHGEPVSMLKCDWVSLMTRCGDQHGDNTRGTRLLAQSYFENFEEALALSDAPVETERLDQVLNVVHERGPC